MCIVISHFALLRLIHSENQSKSYGVIRDWVKHQFQVHEVHTKLSISGRGYEYNNKAHTCFWTSTPNLRFFLTFLFKTEKCLNSIIIQMDHPLNFKIKFNSLLTTEKCILLCHITIQTDRPLPHRTHTESVFTIRQHKWVRLPGYYQLITSLNGDLATYENIKSKQKQNQNIRCTQLSIAPLSFF